ncbi:MAG: CHASE2 domain-containing protein [Cyanothece sp. SIO1E1]|nr:CHASE2 domain-containing protein [Cyanothece sp. SIO1E1]
MPVNNGIEVFFSYSHKDEALRDELEKHLSILQRQGVITGWHDRQIGAGSEWEGEISQHLESARVILLLVSADFLASDYCWNVEVARAMARHEARDARVIPVILRPVSWESAPFGKLQAVPKNAKPITSWENHDEAFLNVAQGITKVVHELSQGSSPRLSKPFSSKSLPLPPKTPIQSENQPQSPPASKSLPLPCEISPEAPPPQEPPSFATKVRQIPKKRGLHTVIGSSLIVTLALLSIRFAGMLEPWELKAFDALMQLRPAEPVDSRLLVIEITENDIQAQLQDAENGQGLALKDPSLNELLQTLEQYQPRVIGLDLYRDFNVDSSVPELANRLRQNQQLITVCKLPATDENGEVVKPGVNPPKGIAIDKVGFSNFVTDVDGAVRRQLMVVEPIPGYGCVAEQAFSLLLARRYLESGQENFGYIPPPDLGSNLQFGNVAFPRVHFFTGGYQGIYDDDYQVLLNYRSPSGDPGKVVRRVKLETFLNGQISINEVKDRIVLIGLTDAESPSDYHLTPYGDLPGVIIHAHMVSQILSAVLDGRRQLWVYPQSVEALWILGWSLGGGILVLCFRSPLKLALASSAALVILGITCLVYLAAFAGWIPLIPPILGLLVSGGIVYIRIHRHTPKSLAPQL